MRTDARRLLKLVVFGSALSAVVSLLDAVYGQVNLLSQGRASSKTRETPRLSTRNQSLSAFLDIVAPKRANSLVWITMADFFYASAGTLYLDHFISTLPPYEGRPHVLIAFCTDGACKQICEKERKYHCYLEYLYNRPEMIADTTWPKIRGAYLILYIRQRSELLTAKPGLPDILSTGRDAIFVDSDVFFKA